MKWMILIAVAIASGYLGWKFSEMMEKSKANEDFESLSEAVQDSIKDRNISDEEYEKIRDIIVNSDIES